VASLPVMFLLVIHALGALAEEPEATDPRLLAAEHERLAGEMEQLARRQHWVGLEDRFRQLAALGVQLRFEELVHGAYSARAAGDVGSTHERLEAALALREDEQLQGWLRSIESDYARVTLGTSPQRSATLQPTVLPFAPDQRAAVDFATAALEERGSFEGWLPAGDYDLDGTTFSVEPGITLRIEVSSRRKRGRASD
jgi:hypothetical protein